MSSHIYGSPFPTLNPRVRYKTALERAGFDVNYNDQRMSSSSPLLFGRIVRGRNASTGNLEDRLEPPKRASARAHSVPENAMKQTQTPLKHSIHALPTSRLGFHRPRPPPAVPVLESVPVATSEKALQVNPIEKSFMILTQNDTISTTDQSADTSRYNSQEFQRETAESSHFSSRSSREMGKKFLTSFIDARSNLQELGATDNEVSDNDSDGLDIAPQSKLQLQVCFESNQVSPLRMTAPATPGQMHQPPSHYSHQILESLGKDTTNIQVENLISQLDDVSLSRTKKLIKPSLRLLPSSQIKNSSAYLSGFRSKLPVISSSPAYSLPQSIIRDSGSVSEFSSPNTADTPLFYNFQKNVQQEYTSNRPRETLQVAPSKSVHVSPPPRSQARLVDPVPNLEFKYPPGSGPCRKCGIEPMGKRIYSKKNNELSGQWHRDCFRCLICNIRFNKGVPCYILDDKPYCRLHFHEENSSICQICGEFIEGECVENDRLERFHVDCLLCFLCREPIIADYFIFNDKLPICSKHDMQSLPQELMNIADNDSAVSKRRTRLVNFSKDQEPTSL